MKRIMFLLTILFIPFIFFGCAPAFRDFVEKNNEEIQVTVTPEYLISVPDSTWKLKIDNYSLSNQIEYQTGMNKKYSDMNIQLFPYMDMFSISYIPKYSAYEQIILLVSTKQNNIVEQFSAPLGSSIYHAENDYFSLFQDDHIVAEKTFASFLKGGVTIPKEISPSKIFIINFQDDKVNREITFPQKRYYGDRESDTKKYGDTLKYVNKNNNQILSKEEIKGGYFDSWIIGNNIFFLNKGLWCFDINNSKKWYFKADHFENDTYKTNFPWYYGPVVYEQYGPGIISGLNSTPFIYKNSVLFSSNKHLANINLTSGEIIWDIEIEGRSGSSFIKIISENVGAYVQRGYDIIEGYERGNYNPNIILFSINDGKIIHSYKPKITDKINDVQFMDGVLYILTEIPYPTKYSLLKCTDGNLINIENLPLNENARFIGEKVVLFENKSILIYSLEGSLLRKIITNYDNMKISSFENQDWIIMTTGAEFNTFKENTKGKFTFFKASEILNGL